MLHAEAKKGVISLKHDLCPESGGTLCPSIYPLPLTSWELDAICYKPDPAWVASHPMIVSLPAPHGCEGVIAGYPGEGALAEPTSGILARAASTVCP